MDSKKKVVLWIACYYSSSPSYYLVPNQPLLLTNIYLEYIYRVEYGLVVQAVSTLAAGL